jgi:hypothetical protein
MGKVQRAMRRWAANLSRKARVSVINASGTTATARIICVRRIVK